jgi:uncharacterized membrane protein YcaP (DUF421 family)
MFDLSVDAGELVLRAAVVYVFLFIGLRWIGKKHVGEMAPFDLLVLLILSETVQNSIVGEDKSLIGGLICAATLLAIAQGMNWLSWRSKWLARLLEGTPKVLVRHGERRTKIMENELVTVSELTEAMRKQGCSNIADVRVAILENDGKITVLKRQNTG